MQEEVARNIMMILAVATPLVAALLMAVNRVAMASGGTPIRGVRRKALLLGVAGPVNLALWWLLNRWLDLEFNRGHSVWGYLIAGLVFVLAGFATGLFARRRADRE